MMKQKTKKLIGLLPHSFRSLVACPTARRTDCSSAHSSLPFVASLPDGLPVASLDGLLVGPLGSLPDGCWDGLHIGLLALPLGGGLPDRLLVGPLVGLLHGEGWQEAYLF
jgi:hypothetical protein